MDAVKLVCTVNVRSVAQAFAPPLLPSPPRTPAPPLWATMTPPPLFDFDRFDPSSAHERDQMIMLFHDASCVNSFSA